MSLIQDQLSRIGVPDRLLDTLEDALSEPVNLYFLTGGLVVEGNKLVHFGWDNIPNLVTTVIVDPATIISYKNGVLHLVLEAPRNGCRYSFSNAVRSERHRYALFSDHLKALDSLYPNSGIHDYRNGI